MAINNNSQPRIQEYIEIFFQRKWLFVVPFVTVMAVATTGSLLVPKVYRAIVKIEVITSSFISGYDISAGVRQQFAILSERVLSRSSLEEVVEKAGLGKSKDSLATQKLIDDLRSSTEIDMLNDQLIKISYNGRDKNRSIKFARILANFFIEESFRKREDETNTAVNFIGSEVELYRDKLEKAEEDIHRPDPLVKRLKSKLLKLEDQLTELLINCKEDHPMVIDLSKSIEETKEELKRATKGKEIDEQILEEVRLERGMRLNESLYGQLLSKLEVARISQRLKTEEEKTKFRLIDQVSVSEIATDRNKIMLSGFVFGILLGIGLIALVDFADHSLRSVEDTKSYLTLPILGSIPKIVVEGPGKESPR